MSTRSVTIIFRLHLVLTSSITHLVDQLHNDQLQDVSEGVDLVYAATQVVQGSLLEKEEYQKSSSIIFHTNCPEKNLLCFSIW